MTGAESGPQPVQAPEASGPDLAPDSHLGEVLIPAETLSARVAELGARISADYKGQSLVLVGILRGSFMFVADLSRRIDVPVTLDFLAISSYVGRDSSGVVRLLKDLDHPITDKHVLLVEDIIDTGLTLSYVLRVLGTRSPASLAVCTLLNKPARRLIDHPLVRYVGFDIPDEFVVGYGLDYNQRYRNLPYIGTITMP
ncbi:MAG TPA: hypoxanthine phosphoribosyltransferase [Chloroflexota bacterium]|nr:hypoxanthine phosphoribosyltransferase [Chloroflexota bacterium]